MGSAWSPKLVARRTGPLTTVDMVEASIRSALGQAPDVAPTLDRAAAIRYLSAEPGKVTRVDGRDAATGMSGVQALDVEVDVGDTVVEVRSSGDRPGWVIAIGRGPREAVARAEAARDTIAVHTEPHNNAGEGAAM